MLISALVVAAACAGPWYKLPGHSAPNSGQRHQATMAWYPSARADDVHRPGFGGRVWQSEPITADHPGVWAWGWDSPGPAAYGAREDEFQLVTARVGHVVVTCSPWEQQDDSRVEAARQEWLKERGYTGGVRSFVNDRALQSDRRAQVQPEVPAGSIIQPRGVIEIAPDVPRFKSRMHVDAGAFERALAHASGKAHTRVLPTDVRVVAK